jgi:hypothetical protein
MAYNFVPKSAEEIGKANLRTFTALNALYVFLTAKVPAVKDPMAIDRNSPNKVKVLRSFSSKVTLAEMRSHAPGLSIDFGNGSRGNAGAGNRGIGFEGEIVRDLVLFDQEGLSAKFENPQFVSDFVSMYGLNSSPTLKILTGGVKAEGALNQRRPLTFMGSQPYIGGPPGDIGQTVTDVTVTTTSKKIFISAKFGGTVTFFNIGVASILTQDEIKSGSIKNVNGLTFLNMFGIDNVKFCSVFNAYGGVSNEQMVDVTQHIDKRILSNFLKSGIGYGFHLVHKTGKVVHQFPVTSKFLDEATTINSVKVRYPIGTAKRVDIYVDTPKMSLKINIRNKQGGVFPSHIMADYSMKYH